MTVSGTSSTPPLQFGGLASGLDTASIISQLMQLESQPQTSLKNTLSAEQVKLAAYKSTNSDISGLGSVASKLAANAAWTTLAATSSNSAISVTASSSATPANVSVTVNQLATASQATWSQKFALTDATDTSFVVRTKDSSGAWVDKTVTGDGTMKGLIDAINDPDNATGLTAAAVNTGNGQYQLIVTSNSTGAASDFQLRKGDGTSYVLTGGSYTVGQDAKISVNGIDATSSSNTFTGIMPGVDITLASGATAGTTSTIAIALDGSSRATSIASLIANLNNVIAGIGVTTSYGTVGTDGTFSGGGSLKGDGTLRSIAQQLTNTIFSAADADYDNTGTSMSLLQMGVSIDKTGTITFDQDAFNAAYAKDPDKVTAAITGEGGFADRISAVTDAATKGVQDPDDPTHWYTGSITGAMDSETSLISSLNDRISDWDDILANKQAALERQYASLETALSALQTQSSWLTSQLDSLPSWSGSSDS